MASKNSGLAKVLAIIGGFLVLIDGIYALLRALEISIGINFDVPGGGGFGLFGLGALINAIIVIILAVLILISTGVVKSSSTNVKFNGITILVLGILVLIFGSFWGPILVIIAGILLLI
jgi:hypothetical protein